jgi:hypothetical protein
MRSLWLFSLLCLVLVAAAAGAVYRSTASHSCRPTFWELADGKSIDVNVGSNLQLGIKAVLIGCEDDLRQAMGPGTQEQIVSVIEEMLRAETWQAWPKSKEQEFRLTVVTKINSILERPVVQDVYLHSFAAAE